LHKLDPDLDLIEAIDYPSAFAAMHRAGEVDLALIDLHMPGMSGMDGVIRFRAAFPEIPLVVLSASELAPRTSIACLPREPWAMSPSPRPAR